MQKALTYLLVRLGDPSEPQASITQCDINSTTPLSYRLLLLADIPSDYKQWLLTQGDIDPYLRKALET